MRDRRRGGGGRKINEYMPPFTPSSIPRVRPSEVTSEKRETDGRTG